MVIRLILFKFHGARFFKESFLEASYFSWLVFLVLWHIDLCRLSNAKSIFMRIVLFQTIQFIISTQF